MKKSLSYKYINLLIRIVIGLGAVYFIYFKLSTDLIPNSIRFDNLQWNCLWFALFLVVINWGIEALKWRYAIQNNTKISIAKALRLTFTGITIGFLTPNRVGEIPARAALLKHSSFNLIVLKTLVSSFSQLVVTFLVGGIGLVITQHYFSLKISNIALNSIVFIVLVALLLFYFNVKKCLPILKKIKFLNHQKLLNALLAIRTKKLLHLLLYSTARYLVFCVQYYLVLQAFGVTFPHYQALFLIPVCFLIASSIPTLLISEIGVRGSVALFVFGAVSNLDVSIVVASIVLWCINVALPAILGLYDLKELKLIKEK